MGENTETVTQPPAAPQEGRQPYLVAYLEDLMAQVKAGHVTQLFAVAGDEAHEPVLYLNHGSGVGGQEFVRYVCAGISGVMDQVWRVNAPYSIGGKPN